jgi:hypothetical protein
MNKNNINKNDIMEHTYIQMDISNNPNNVTIKSYTITELIEKCKKNKKKWKQSVRSKL